MPLSLEARTRRIASRLQALEQFLDWTEEHDNPGAAREGFYGGLSELLHDIGRDVRFLSGVPFPMSEWQGQSWEDFLNEYDQPDNTPDES